MQSLEAWVKANPKLAGLLIPLVLTILSGVTGWQFAVHTAQPGQKPGIVIILPDDFGNVFEGEPAIAGAVPGNSQMALRAAGSYLKRNKLDRDPVFGMLRKLHDDTSAIEKYESQAKDSPRAKLSKLVLESVLVAIEILKRSEPETLTKFDQRLLAFLVAFESDPFVVSNP